MSTREGEVKGQEIKGIEIGKEEIKMHYLQMI